MVPTQGFAQQIWSNQFKSILLLMGFPFLLLLMIYAFFTGIDMLRPGSFDGANSFHAGWIGLEKYGYIAVSVALVWFTIAWFFHDTMMSMAAHSQPVTRAQMPKIYNMLENLCISRGIPMPKFEVIDSPAMNAFATGMNEKTYKIVLTRGIIEKLQDDELEAVIGHELTHIMNRDVRLLVISVIFVGMISFFCQMLFRSIFYGGRPNYYSRSSSSGGGKRDNQGAIIIVAMVVLAVGYMFALVIRFALSRKREFLADAGSVDLTKNPEAMMRALLRISGNDTVTGMPGEVQQMCIENSHNFMGVFATHPSIPDRLSAISRTTGTEIPSLSVSLRRAPDTPWNGGTAPEAPPSAQKPWGTLGGGARN